MSGYRDVLVSNGAFAKPAQILQAIPFDKVTLRPQNAPHSLFEELYHLDYWQTFMLSSLHGQPVTFPKHNSESFPPSNKVTEEEWHKLVSKVLADLEKVIDVAELEVIAVRKTPHGDTLEDVLVALVAHNAYHFGRMVMLRQLLGIWSPELGDSW
jgi:uncharacterized damage-inducible protein DinB